MESKKYFFSAFASFGVIILLLLLFTYSSPFHKTFAASPTFELQEIRNQRNHWIQTYGNDSTHLKSDYTNILAADYLSDGKTLDATFWLASNLQNGSTYNQPFKKISYGMQLQAQISPQAITELIMISILKQLMEKWSQYLYQLSSLMCLWDLR